MRPVVSLVDLELIGLMALVGLALGIVYFRSLKFSVAAFVGGKGWQRPVAFTLGRLGAAVAFLAVAAKFGAAPLLASFIGFLLARALALRAEKRGS